MKTTLEIIQKRLALSLPYAQQSKNLVPTDKQARVCAVMLILYPFQGDIFIPFMLRPSHEKGVHGGQISFPGGGKESTDEDLAATALRETVEEIGVNIPKNHVLGKLSDIYVPPSNSLVSPYIAFLEQKPDYYISELEVDKILDIPLTYLKNHTAKKMETYQFSTGQSYQMPAYYWQNHRIWGATARILSEFLWLLDDKN